MGPQNIQGCNAPPYCPVNGQWGSWGSLGPCDPRSGKQSQSRFCDSPAPKRGGAPCRGRKNRIRTCKVDGEWGPWKPWGKCNSATGEKSRSRNCNNPAPKNGGSKCPGEPDQTENCNCNGEWGSWGPWGECEWDEATQKATKSRSRSCDNPAPKNGCSSCPGDSNETQDCRLPRSLASALSPASTECNTESGQQCIFPFDYEVTVGEVKRFNTCTYFGNHPSEKKPWCSTEVDKNNIHIQGKWGWCGNGC